MCPDGSMMLLLLLVLMKTKKLDSDIPYLLKVIPVSEINVLLNDLITYSIKFFNHISWYSFIRGNNEDKLSATFGEISGRR